MKLQPRLALITALLAAGCGPNAVTPPATSPSPAASASPAASPTPAPTASAEASTAPGASPSAPGPSPTTTTGPCGPYVYTPGSAPVASGKTDVVAGTVYDEAGNTVDGATVTITSLDQAVPYTASTTANFGAWVINNVPEGANVEIVAGKNGFTSRRRLGSYSTCANQKNVVDFGGTNQPEAAAFFISSYPEVSKVEAGDGQVSLTFSEPLDSANGDRLAAAVRVFPASAAAAPDNDDYGYPNQLLGGLFGAGYLDLHDQRVSPFTPKASLDRPVDPDPQAGYSAALGKGHPLPVGPGSSQASAPAPWDYSVKAGSAIFPDARQRAGTSWDDAHQVLTLKFQDPLLAGGRYNVGLVAPSASDKILDRDNRQLGTNVQGSLTAYPVRGALIHAAFKEPDLTSAPAAPTSDAAGRWVATHQDAAQFDTPADTTAPTLLAVSYQHDVGKSCRFVLRFDEPLAAYNGRLGGHVGAAIANGTLLDHLTLAASDHAGGLGGVTLQGGQPGFMLDPRSPGARFGAVGGDLNREAGLAAVSGNPGAAMAVQANVPASHAEATLAYGQRLADVEANRDNLGKYLLELDPNDLKTLYLDVVGVPNVFDARVVEFGLRLEGMTDAAGNAAGAQAQTGTL